MPIGELLVAVRSREHGGFFKVVADDLQTDWQFLMIKPARHRHARQPGK
jgi:hypothetical protein